MSSAQKETVSSSADHAPAYTANTAPGCKLAVSEGQRLLMAVPGSHAKVAASVGAFRQSIAEWRSGRKLPGEKFRAALAKVHRIPAASWDEIPNGHEPSPAPADLRAALRGVVDALVGLDERVSDLRSLIEPGWDQ